jgi:hypothetical protein
MTIQGRKAAVVLCEISVNSEWWQSSGSSPQLPLKYNNMIIKCKLCGKDLTSKALALLENLNGNKKWSTDLKCCSESTTKDK